VTRIASIVRDFPRVTTVALLTDAGDEAPSAVLALGRSGIRTLIDARRPAAWHQLRDAVSQSTDATAELEMNAVQQISADLPDAPSDCRRFFALLFTAPVTVTTVEALSRALDVAPTTLVSRFARRALPSPKTYLVGARITRAAAILEDPAVSVAAAATSLEYSSPQSFGRHLLARLGVTPTEFRETYDAARMLERFRCELVLPHAAALRTFAPLAPPCINGRHARCRSGLAIHSPSRAPSSSPSSPSSASSASSAPSPDPFRRGSHLSHDLGSSHEHQHRQSFGLDGLASSFLAIHEREHPGDHAAAGEHGLGGP
jgi:AraC-like DNA-binding protein